jgi:hypothetical protein
MSIAADFRAKWDAIMQAADKTVGKDADARYSAMARAAHDSDHILMPRAMVLTYQRTIEKLKAEVNDAAPGVGKEIR